MPVISIKNSRPYSSNFEGAEYVIDTERRFGGYEKGDLICYTSPFFGIPLTLEIAIRIDGSLVFRKWQWSDGENHYLHTHEKPDSFTATVEQCDTVNGLFSGRIKFEGLKLIVGATVQHICPIDIEREEELVGKKLYVC